MIVAVYDLEGYHLENVEGNDKREISEKLGISLSALSQCLDRRQLAHKSRQYVEVVYSRTPLRIGGVYNLIRNKAYCSPIAKFYKSNYICTYESVEEACIKNDIKQSNISAVLTGLRRTAGGFEWKYVSNIL